MLSITRRPGTPTVGQLDPIPTVLYYRHGLCTLSALHALSFCTAAAAVLRPTGKLLFRKRHVFSPEEPAEQQHASIVAKIVGRGMAARAARFSDRETVTLISYYHGETLLWQREQHDYHNTQARTEAFRRIATQLGPQFTCKYWPTVSHSFGKLAVQSQFKTTASVLKQDPNIRKRFKRTLSYYV